MGILYCIPNFNTHCNCGTIPDASADIDMGVAGVPVVIGVSGCPVCGVCGATDGFEG